MIKERKVEYGFKELEILKSVSSENLGAIRVANVSFYEIC